MEGYDQQKVSLGLNLEVLINKDKGGVCQFKGYCE